tara:strand:+ start:307 stop:1746 length:1440 start_codon:yes stop_codon:yes gene_type:complete
MATGVMAKDMSGWSDKTVCRLLIGEPDNAEFLTEAQKRELKCDSNAKSGGTKQQVGGKLIPNKFSTSVSFDTIAEADELTFLGSADVDNDGIDDIVISGQASSEGYDAGQGLQPYILLSNQGNFIAKPLPIETKTGGVWGGAFLDVKGKKFFYYGHNGEETKSGPDGLEISSMPSLTIGFLENGDPFVAGVAKSPTMTSSVEAFKVGSNNYVVENNYDNFATRIIKKSTSIIYKVSEKGQLLAHKVRPRLVYENSKPMNHIAVMDLNNNQSPDFIVSTEKERRGKNFDRLVAGDPRSYVVFDAFESPTKVYLDPPAFGDLHSGFNGNIFKSNASSNYYVSLASMKNNLTWDYDKKKFVGFDLTLYRFNEEQLIEAFPIKTNLQNATMLKSYNHIINNKEALVFGRYRTAPFYVTEANGEPIKKFISGLPRPTNGRSNILIPITDRTNRCLRFVTMAENPERRVNTAHISACKINIEASP